MTSLWRRLLSRLRPERRETARMDPETLETVRRHELRRDRTEAVIAEYQARLDNELRRRMS